MITSGERLEYDGEIHRLPLPDSAGVPIRSVAKVPDIPIYVASLGPANLALTGELADGWIGNSFFTDTASVYFDQIHAGARTAGRSLSDLDLTAAVSVEFTDDVNEAGRRHADGYAFTFGAMGSGSKNFYNDAFHVRATAPTSPRCNGCGARVTVPLQQLVCPSRSDWEPT